jgi:hypothetical protein
VRQQIGGERFHTIEAETDARRRPISREDSSNSLIYLYISAITMLAFALFGYVLGRQADRLRQLSTTDILTGL